MKTKLIFSFLVFLISAFFSSCKDECPTYYAHPEALAYGAFKEGSWWIYQDDSTGERDCVFVSKLKVNTYEETIDKKCRLKWLEYQTTMSIEHQSNAYQYFVNLELNDLLSNRIVVTNVYYVINYPNTSTFKILIYNDNLIFKNAYYEILENAATKEVNGKIYDNVITMKNKKISDTSTVYVFWLSPKIGIIKMSGTGEGVSCKSLLKYNVENYE